MPYISTAPSAATLKDPTGLRVRSSTTTTKSEKVLHSSHESSARTFEKSPAAHAGANANSTMTEHTYRTALPPKTKSETELLICRTEIAKMRGSADTSGVPRSHRRTVSN